MLLELYALTPTQKGYHATPNLETSTTTALRQGIVAGSPEEIRPR
jgi:hypothetical protein